jgi:hypothetical protein
MSRAPRVTAESRDEANRFTNDTSEHVMSVLLDEGLYRHLRFQAPGTGMYWFEVVTWPGSLTIRGDMGTFVFSRVTDMFEFFRGQGINPTYWAEKEASGAPTKRYDQDHAERLLREHVSYYAEDYDPEDLVLIEDAVTAAVEDWDWAYAEGAHRLLMELRVPLSENREFELSDTWEWDLTTWTAQYLWCCHAILSAIKQYDEVRTSRPLEDAR